MENHFLETLKALLKEKSLVRKDLSEMTGISFNTINGWFTKGFTPDAFTAVKIAKVLDTTVEYLVTGETSTSPERIKLKQMTELIEQLYNLV